MTRQSIRASDAASMADFAAWRPPSGKDWITAPVAGLNISNFDWVGSLAQVPFIYMTGPMLDVVALGNFHGDMFAGCCWCIARLFSGV